MSRILVTGGAGFIGHNVVRELEELGHDVIIMDNLTTYGIVDKDLLDSLMVERLSAFNGKLLTKDITSDVMPAYINIWKPEMIIHFAAFPRAKLVNLNPEEGVPTMTTGLMNLLGGAAKHNIRRFVYISSSMVYGDFENGISEDAICKPGSIYASLKLAGEHITKRFAEKHNFEYTIVRPSAVYGPRDVEDRIVSKFLLNAMNGGVLHVHGKQEKLDFSYVDDVARGITLAALNENAANETFNITAGSAETIYEAAQTMVELVGSGTIEIGERNPEMPSRGYLNIDKARSLLGYTSTIPIYTGFKLYYDWAKRFYSV